MNLIVGSALLLIPAIVTAVSGPRPIAVTLPSKVVHYYADQSILMGAMFGILVPLGLLLTVFLYARYFASRASPPMNGEVAWANQALSSYALIVIGLLSMVSWIIWRMLASNIVLANPASVSPRVLSLLQGAPFLSFLFGGFIGAALDLISKRENRFANVVSTDRTSKVEPRANPS